MFTYCLTQCISVDTLPFLCEWQHAKVGFPYVVARAAPLNGVHFLIRICEQVFISALHSVQMLKYIGHVCQSYIPLITCKQLCVITPLISQKHFWFLPQLIQTGQHSAPRQPPDLSGAIRLYAPLPFRHTEMQICGILAVLPLQSLSYAQHLPAQVPGLLVKSWQRVPPGAKKQCITITLGVSLSHG